jgi:hypothetical protein
MLIAFLHCVSKKFITLALIFKDVPKATIHIIPVAAAILK